MCHLTTTLTSSRTSDTYRHCSTHRLQVWRCPCPPGPFNLIYFPSRYAPYENCNSSNDNDNFVCLNTSHWNDFHEMAMKSGSDFLFGISFGLVQACIEKGRSPPCSLALGSIGSVRSEALRVNVLHRNF